MSAKKARESKNEFDESTKRKTVAESNHVGTSYEIVTDYPHNDISTTRITSVNPQPASGRLITWDDTKFAIGICYFDEQARYLEKYDIWETQSPYICRDYPYMSITIRKLDDSEITTSEIGDARLMLANTVLPYEPYGATIWEPCTVKRYHNDAWIDTEEYVRGRYPNIFDVDSVQSIIRNNVVTTSEFSNVDGVITLAKSVGNDGRYAYNELLSFEINEVYEITFDVLLEGTNSSCFISIAVLNPSNMDAVSTELFNYPVEKDTWVSVAEELTLSAAQGALSIQARNSGNSIKIKNIILRKRGTLGISSSKGGIS